MPPIIKTGTGIQVNAIDLESALQVSPRISQYEILGAVLPTADLGQHGILPQQTEHAVYRATSAALPAALYASGIFVGPAEGFALRIRAVQAYVFDGGGAPPPNVFNTGLRVLTNANLCLQQTGQMFAPNRAEQFVIAHLGVHANPLVFPGAFDFPESLARPESTYQLAVQAGVAARMDWDGDLVLVRRQGIGPGVVGVSYMWERTPLLNDIDVGVLHVVYSAAPAGLYPPI